MIDADRIRALIPHRPPLLLVDGAEQGPNGSLRAWKDIRADEPVLAGHFPGQPVWPGVYVIEGLAQACAVMGALAGGPKREVLMAQVQVKLVAPVIPPARLDYDVRATHAMDGLVRCEVEASVAGKTVAKGTLMLAEVKR